MKRRRVLATLGALVLPTAAGCSGGDGTGSTPTDSPSPTPSPTPTTPNQQAVAAYDDAIATLVETKGVLDGWAADGFDGDAQRLDALRGDVSAARESLDTAKTHADPAGALRPRIDQARLVADVQQLTIAYYDGVLVFWQVLSDARAFGDAEQHQRAADKWSDAGQVIADVRQVIDDMGTVLGDLDTAVLDEPELEYPDDPLDRIDLLDRQGLDAAEEYITAYEHTHLALVQLDEGSTHYEDEAYGEARQAWETGRSHLDEALSGFEAVVDNQHGPQEFHDDSINMLGIVETLIEAFDKFVEGATEAEAGNIETANQLVGEGFNLLSE